MNHEQTGLGLGVPDLAWAARTLLARAGRPLLLAMDGEVVMPVRYMRGRPAEGLHVGIEVEGSTSSASRSVILVAARWGEQCLNVLQPPPAAGRRRMVGTKDLVADDRDALQELSGGSKIALTLVHQGQIVEAHGGVQMVGTEDALADGHCALQ